MVATSAAVTPVGYEGVIDLAAEAGTGTEISVGNGPWVVGSTISEGQSFRVRTTSSSSFGQARTVSVSAGTRSVGFTVTTRPERVTPAVFAFSPSSNVSPVSYVVSGVARLTEMDPVTVSVEDGEYQICATPTCSDQTQWKTEATENVTDGSYVRLRVRSGAVAERVTARLIAGEGSATYVVSTRDHLSYATPWGGNVAHGASVRAYQYSTRSTASACTSASEIRTCVDGDLAGSYRNSFCEVPRNVAVTCTSNAGATRTITTYANG